MARIFFSLFLFFTPVIWGIAYPFIYGQLLSRLFGLNKNIDHWILFFLHICIFIFEIFLFIFFGIIFRFNVFAVYFLLLICFALCVVLEGLVWQYLLRDRKMNGFLISLICNVIFIVPYIICILLSFKKMFLL